MEEDEVERGEGEEDQIRRSPGLLLQARPRLRRGFRSPPVGRQTWSVIGHTLWICSMEKGKGRRHTSVE